MLRVVKLVALVGMAAVLVFAATSWTEVGVAAPANGATSPAGPGVQLPAEVESLPGVEFTTLLNRSLKKTHMRSRDIGDVVNVGAGFVNWMAPITIKCPGTSGTCTYKIKVMYQFGGGPGGTNRAAICATVDGSANGVLPSCPFSGLVIPGHFEVRYSQQFRSGLGTGNHTVGLLFYSDFGATLGLGEVNIQVYKP